MSSQDALGKPVGSAQPRAEGDQRVSSRALDAKHLIGRGKDRVKLDTFKGASLSGRSSVPPWPTMRLAIRRNSLQEEDRDLSSIS